MTYSDKIKRVDLVRYAQKDIDVNLIKAQYNSDRFKHWKALHVGPEEEVLNMWYSPHYELLNLYKSGDLNDVKGTSYYQLQKRYGRSDIWIRAKINAFIELFESIKHDGIRIPISVLSKPLVANSYNDGYELFEGHHRLACYLILKKETISCRVIR